ncbi:hypothetical protein R1sor_020054 [Riccia sorocarpa]|uniref:Retrovirus-related Pol polyprotein from transposon TNT 1-94-like beta-barrel domain-containing protein n=1 Tax=Riccia sorocarpa TaxID=122646 RepID=A0ABD3IEF6_9MARC
MTTKPVVSVTITDNLLQESHKLNSSTFLSWKYRVKAILSRHDLWEIVTGDEALPEGDGAAVWHKRDRTVLSIIWITIQESEFHELEECKTSKEAMDKITTKHGIVAVGKSRALKTLLQQLKMDEGKSMEEHVKHYAFECNKKARAERNDRRDQPQANIAAEVGVSQPDKTQESLFFTALYAEDYENPWWIDSGTSNHISEKRELFRNIKSILDGQTVGLGNGERYQVQGSGDIHLQLSSGPQFLLHNMWYILGVVHNLLSVGKLIEYGYHVTFDAT